MFLCFPWCAKRSRTIWNSLNLMVPMPAALLRSTTSMDSWWRAPTHSGTILARHKEKTNQWGNVYIYIYDFTKITPYHKPLPRESLANSELYVLPAYRKDTGRRQVTRQASLGIHSESTRHVLVNSGNMSGKQPHCALHVRVHISGLWLPAQT